MPEVCASAAVVRRMPLTICYHRWVNQRVVFGKKLSAQAVVRAKLANMIARIEAGQNWLESITYQMNHVRRPRAFDFCAAQFYLYLPDVLRGDE